MPRHNIPDINCNKGPWSKDEDIRLIHFVSEQIEDLKRTKKTSKTTPTGRKSQLRWQPISNKVKTRSSKQCRERWVNHLDPKLSREEWSVKEDKLLLKLGSKYPNKWAYIAQQLPGRSQNHVKVRWKSLTNVKRCCPSEVSKIIESNKRVKLLPNYVDLEYPTESHGTATDPQYASLDYQQGIDCHTDAVTYSFQECFWNDPNPCGYNSFGEPISGFVEPCTDDTFLELLFSI